jgi:hypothetical protein
MYKVHILTTNKTLNQKKINPSLHNSKTQHETHYELLISLHLLTTSMKTNKICLIVFIPYRIIPIITTDLKLNTQYLSTVPTLLIEVPQRDHISIPTNHSLLIQYSLPYSLHQVTQPPCQLYHQLLNLDVAKRLPITHGKCKVIEVYHPAYSSTTTFDLSSRFVPNTRPTHTYFSHTNTRSRSSLPPNARHSLSSPIYIPTLNNTTQVYSNRDVIVIHYEQHISHIPMAIQCPSMKYTTITSGDSTPHSALTQLIMESKGRLYGGGKNTTLSPPIPILTQPTRTSPKWANLNESTSTFINENLLIDMNSLTWSPDELIPFNKTNHPLLDPIDSHILNTITITCQYSNATDLLRSIEIESLLINIDRFRDLVSFNSPINDGIITLYLEMICAKYPVAYMSL